MPSLPAVALFEGALEGVHVTVVVEMTHQYLSLEYVVHAIAKAVVGAHKQGEGSGASYEEAMGAAMLAWESRLRELCEQRAIKGHDWDTLKENDWLYLNIERDVFSVDGLNACKPLTDAGLRFKVVPDADAQEEFAQWFGESVYNDRPIDWEYWVLNMPTLSAGDAARLMCGLDPDVFKTLEERPNRNDASKAIAVIQKTERLALAQGKDRDTPEMWLQWAKAHRLPVQLGFQRAVRAKQKRDAAPVEIAGRKERTVQLAGYTSPFWATDEEFEAMAREVDERQAKGHFTLAEAAQILAEHLGADPEDMRKRLQTAFFDAKLVVRDPKTEIPLTRADTLRPWLNIVYSSDVDQLLAHHWRVTGYTFVGIVSQAAGVLPQTTDENKPRTQSRLKAPERDDGLAYCLYRTLVQHEARTGEILAPRGVMDLWTASKPREVAEVMADGVKYYDAQGEYQEADLKNLRDRIRRMTVAQAR